MRRVDRLIWTCMLSASTILVLVLLGQAGARSRALDESLTHPADSPAKQAAPAAGAAGWQMVGQVGGHTEDVAVQGAYAYVAVGLRLVVLDVSQSITPTEVGSTTPFPQFVEGVAVSGTLAYGADGVAGLRVVDVSDPSAPVEIGWYDTPGYAEGVAVVNQYAYIADGHYGLRIVDVSDPTDPAEVAYAYPLNYVFDVVVDGQYAYLAAAGAGLLVVDVSDPARPVELGACDTPGYAYGVDAVGDTVYVADGWEGLRVVSAVDPAHPAEIGSCSTPGWSFGVDIVGDRAYVADAFAGLQVVDVSDPAHPAGLGGYEVAGGHAGRVVVKGNLAYVADRNWGLHILDVSDPTTPSRTGFYGPMGYARRVVVDGDYAYVAATTQGLRIVDISDPTHPAEIGVYETIGEATAVAVAGDTAYVTAGYPKAGAGLHVVDVSDPAHPNRIGFLEPAGAYRDVVISGTIAYIADEWGLELIDVSSPYSPTLIGHIMLQEGEELKATTGVDVSGTLAYVAGDGGFHVVDVSNPVSPTLVSHLEREWPFDVDVAGTRAYVTGDGGSCLSVIDVADPLHPTWLSAYCGPPMPERVNVLGETAYVADGNSGLWGVNVANPLTPTLAFSYDTPGYATEAVFDDNYAYVADGQGGLLILEMQALQSRVIGSTWSESTPSWESELLPTFGHKPRLRIEEMLPTFDWPQEPADPVVQRMAGTCVVTNTADSGAGTLRECMENAVSGDTILFDPAVFPPTSPVTITPTSSLPILVQGHVTIDASSAGVILDGSLQEGSLGIASDGNVVMGLQILNFPWAGVHICCGSQDNTIGGNRTRGSGPTGEGNVISYNGVLGVSICDTGTMSNTVIGNLIGTDASGTQAWPNGFDGVNIYHGASYNQIGSLTPGEGNVISGNANSGVACSTDGTRGNLITGNLIGTDISGTAALGNTHSGVNIESGSLNNTVQENVISGNGWNGVGMGDPPSGYNVVIGNLIGTDVTGTEILGNGREGVSTFATHFNRIGGTADGERNVIAGNLGTGNIVLNEYGHNLILGNYIGTDIHGSTALSNTGNGIMVWSGHNFIGGATEAERNVIGGNAAAGIRASGGERNVIVGNYVGTDASGSTALPNGRSGIEADGARHTVIQSNWIAGNVETGVWIGHGSDLSHLRANRIGIAGDDVSPLPNDSDGVSIWAASNTVGGPYPEDGNVIAFNANVGVQVWTYPGNTIHRNAIYSNAYAGISLNDGGNNSLPAPVIIAVLPTSVSGTACPGCTVEIFSDEADEGQVYEGYTIADGNGNWTWMGSPDGPYVTATATDEVGNTSCFSVPQLALWHQLYLPLTLKGGD